MKVYIYIIGELEKVQCTRVSESTALEKAYDIEVAYEIVDRRPGDIASCYADASKAERELGWTAKRDIISMCRDAWRFEKNYLESKEISNLGN